MRAFASISAVMLLVSGLLRGLAEVVGSAYEGDADYLIYQAQLMLIGNSPLPWVQEFDDKFPVTYLFFLPSALLMNVRPFQVMNIVGLLVSAVLLMQICKEVLNTGWSRHEKASGWIALLVGALYFFMQTVLPSSITTINVLSVIFFVMGLWVLMFGIRRKALGVSLTIILAGLLMAISISIRPYMLLPGVLVMPWLLLRASQAPPMTPFLLFVALWGWVLGLWGLALNALPFVVFGQADVFWGGIKLLGQNIIPSNVPFYLQFQIKNILALSNWPFIAFGSLLALPLLRVVRGRVASDSEPRLPSKPSRVDLLFIALVMPLAIEVTIMRKHYYPHYLQLFTPFACLALGMLLAYLYNSFLANLAIRDAWSRATRSGGGVANMAMASIVLINLLLLRGDLASALNDLVYRRTDNRMAEFVTFLQDPKLKPVVQRGFLYPESMSMHWKFRQHRYGFPNTFNSELIGGGAWENLVIPEALMLPKSAEQYCSMLGEKKPPFVITKTGWIQACLDGQLAANYKKIPTIDHRLIDSIQKQNGEPPYRLTVYQFMQP